MATSHSSESDSSVNNKDDTLIVLAAPSVKNRYYSAVFQQIIDYIIHFVQIVRKQNDVVILVDKGTRSYFHGQVPDHSLIEAEINDIWIRDFAPVLPAKQIKFRYAPRYHRPTVALDIDTSFERWMSNNHLTYQHRSDIILDGGNVVDNPEGSRVIMTDRLMKDNPGLSKADIKAELQNLLGARQIAIIPELSDDTTAHADGMVMWAENTKVLVQTTSEPERTQIIQELKTSFPEVDIVEIPDYYEHATWRGFTSACNIFVNALVTDRYIYMPTFKGVHDRSMYDLLQSQTQKKVIAVPAEKVCFMGGSVRCLTWQVKGNLREKILQLAPAK